MTDDLVDVEPPPARSARWGVTVLVALLALVSGVAGTLLVVRATSQTSVTDFGADAGFARDMQTHHRQAVEMAFIVRDESTDPAVRTLAYDIATSQQQQAGQMYGWLVQWGLPQTGPAAPMAWVGGEHPAHVEAGAPMPGLATEAQLDALRGARGVDADRIFLRLMIAHHQGGVEMADAALAQARTREVRTLAGAIATAQTREITLMEGMLRERS
ncbi:DUF305 domain-containing protein [Phycicoccus duodecadis]|uniref:Uncharacterized protein (DUF305 family) n=1 Tax=Phycicoccus duodecadis TaxID=173053 RepID=A0A2N3YES2_9MICO|nr:DUF305 domain-containing protein [Phycicoccus duodecadis]PKW25364.1 uncharacterized protein (DUF305 family) [Phycicoccus duodecadis]